MAKELTIFTKKRTKADGKTFISYLTKLAKKDGTEITATIKFKETCDAPKEYPCNILVEKKDANLSERTFTREDTGELAKGYTLWVSEWKKGSPYVDHSLDEFDF